MTPSCGVRSKMADKIRLLKYGSRSFAGHFNRKKYCTTPNYIYPSESDEYTPNPLYPQIEKTDPASVERKKKQKWEDSIKKHSTVEEKIIAVNVPRRFGWKCFMIQEGVIPFDNLVFTQHMTRTHLIETDGLPDFYQKYSEKSSALTERIKNEIVDRIEYQLNVRHHKVPHNPQAELQDKELTKIIITELNRAICSALWDEESYLKQAQIDYSPRIESSWKINSLVETFVPKQTKFGRPLEELPEEYLERPSDKFIQYIGQPILQVRHIHPLPPIVNFLDGNIFQYSVPVFKYDPHITLGYQMERRHITNIPGFWPGDEREFSFLSYHFSNHIKSRPPTFGPIDAKETLQSQAILASFGWLKALTCYQGFSCYQDVTYPFMTQTVLTDGRDFAFALYQLNTTTLHHENPMENSRSNICWMTPSLPLFEALEDGKLKGFNDDVLKKLVCLYVNEPTPMLNENLKPYLGSTIKHVADFEDDEKAEWLQKTFKRVQSNKHNENADKVYEVYDWEKIFKIKYMMRPRDAAKRPFELRENPYHAKMSDFKGEYVPKALRPDKDLPKYRQRKFKKTFFPDEEP